MISGFHKLKKSEKIDVLAQESGLDKSDRQLLQRFSLSDETDQNRLESFSENVIGNYHLPYSIIPNMVVNGKNYFVPAVTEESSVIAAAAASAKFWADKGGFVARIIGTVKKGTIYFNWTDGIELLQSVWNELQKELINSTDAISEGMRSRGGGILSLNLSKLTKPSDEFCITVNFDTQDAMGANFINSCLEQMADKLSSYLSSKFPKSKPADITMAILSNHTPECVVECKVECDVSVFNNSVNGMTGAEFATKFKRAVDIAGNDSYRAVTHNKGIMNGVASVVLATGNDFRAIEAASHAYAVQEEQYRSLSKVTISNDLFTFLLKIPLALGTVGGLTSVHPMADLSLRILKQPDAKELMRIVAACGLASNFAAIKSLISDGIQKGHMRMHLNNLLLNLNATNAEALAVRNHFSEKSITAAAVKKFVEELRKQTYPKHHK